MGRGPVGRKVGTHAIELALPSGNSDGDGEPIVSTFARELSDMHDTACEAAGRIAMVGLEEPFDVVHHGLRLPSKPAPLPGGKLQTLSGAAS